MYIHIQTVFFFASTHSSISTLRIHQSRIYHRLLPQSSWHYIAKGDHRSLSSVSQRTRLWNVLSYIYLHIFTKAPLGRSIKHVRFITITHNRAKKRRVSSLISVITYSFSLARQSASFLYHPKRRSNRRTQKQIIECSRCY